MAKKKKQQRKPTQPAQKSPANIATNLLMKGMVKDMDSAYVDKKNWVHARNAINNSIDGDTGVIGNEPANLLCAEIPYTVIGGIHLYGDKWILFSTDNEDNLNEGASEIGEFDDSKCEYTTLVNDDCLSFHKDYLVIGVAKENFDCSWQIYWDDGNNPSRTLNLTNIPYKQYVSSILGADCVTYENETPLQLDCERIRLAPLLDTPTINLSKANEGGMLPNGMYQVFIAYSINDQIVGDYLGQSNLQSVWSYENTTGSLNCTFSNIDKEFEFMQVVVRARVHNGFTTYVLGFYSTETTQLNIDYLDPDLQKIKSSRLLLRNPAYEKSKGMFEVNDYLIRTQPTEQFDFNYQPSANNILTEWTSAEYPSNYYQNGGNHPTFLRDEQYTFFIRFIYNTGEKSKAYHIPGRPPAGTEDQLDTTVNGTWDNSKEFKVHNTASYSSTLSGPTGDGGTFVSYGQMGYWESNEKYPATDSIRWNNGTIDLCGKNIRHHKMPDENTAPDGTTRLSTDDGDNIYIIGAQFSNIAPPTDNSGNIISNILGYEILVGNRDGNKSIIAKGIIRNMMSYERREHVRSITYPSGTTDYHDPLWGYDGPIAAATADLLISTTTPVGQTDIKYGLMPNYPFNDLGSDPFLMYRGNGDMKTDINPWLSNIVGGLAVENNWLTGKGHLIKATQDSSIHYSVEFGDLPMSNYHPSASPGVSRAMAEFTRDTHTFHSPDLNFTHMYLNPTELKVYKTLYGNQTGNFIKSEKHPGAKLLKNKAVLIAAIIGVGYALNEMRGKRNNKIQTARSQSAGDAKAVGSGMSPMPGVGTAASAVNILLTLPGVIIGSVADIAFNTIVDVASIVGAGKLARQIGTPIYQMIETGTTALMAGHLGPGKEIEYVGTDFTSVPTLFAMVTGILSFLNYVTIGGDKIITLILAIVDFQDYAYKYNSHGFYSEYKEFGPNGCVGSGCPCYEIAGKSAGTFECTGQFRHQMDRARYIKPGINYLDGNTPINNLHRPATVVLRTSTNIDTPAQRGHYDKSKFVIGGGQCVGNGNSTLSWYTPTGSIETSIAAQYVGLKIDNDSQYGQLDSILFTPMSQPFRFIEAPGITALTDVVPSTRFTTGPLFGGDTFIARYTEKVTMPFWYDFMREGPDGLPFDYRFYSNIPFPRYWMNTEKYRMDEFVRPIMNLSFDFSTAFPSDMYHLDQPTQINCAAVNGEYPGEDGNTAANYNEDYNFHLQVLTVPTSYNIQAMLENKSTSSAWSFSGVAKSTWITHPGESASWYTAPNVGVAAPALLEQGRDREVAAGIMAFHGNHRCPTPLVKWSGGDCIYSYNDDWWDFCNPAKDTTPPQHTHIDGVSCPFRAMYNWNSGKFEHAVHRSTPAGVIGSPNWTGSGGCNHNGQCTISGNINSEFGTLKECIKAGGTWKDSCVPEDDPRDFRYYTLNQKKKEKGWFSGTIKMSSGTFNVKGNGSVPGGTCGDHDCCGRGAQFYRPGSENRNGTTGTLAEGYSAQASSYHTSSNPDTGYSNKHNIMIKGGAPAKSSDISGGAKNDSYSNENLDTTRKTGGLFVESLGYMYTHNSGVQDFFVESDMNLAYRDWEDVPRKRHYDAQEYTDYHQLFHADHVDRDNYYAYDKSLNIRRNWSSSFGIMQPRWYDPTVSETCFTKFPKRLLYSLPSVGHHTKELQQFKRDEVADHWRVFLPENFRDFKSKINTVVNMDKTGAILLFPTLSPQLFKGVDSIRLADSGNKLVIGDGGLFSQAFQNVTNSNVSHEYGSCESSRSVLNTPAGLFYISQEQGKIFQYTGKGLKDISSRGMKWWFNKYLPSQLLKDFPDIESYAHIIDNPVVSAGCQSIYDPNNDIIYFSKRDYKAHADKVDDISITPDGRWMYSDAVTQQSVEIEVNDTDYFEDISWTVSFDPKAGEGAWISFHDWHPELAFNSINHFMTTKKAISETPICPPGYTYNGSTSLCEISSVGSQPAAIVPDIILATNTSDVQNAVNTVTQVAASNTWVAGGVCIMDIVVSMDWSGSTGGGGRRQAQQSWLTSFINNTDIAAGLTSGDIQMGFCGWASSSTKLKSWDETSSTHSSNFSMDNQITAGGVKSWYDDEWCTGSCGTSVTQGLQEGESLIQDKAGSRLGDRSSSTGFKEVLILVTDTESGCGGMGTYNVFQGSGFGSGTDTNTGRELHALFAGGDSPIPGDPDCLDAIVCQNGNINASGSRQYGIAGNNSAGWPIVADALTDQICQPIGECECPTTGGPWTMNSTPCNFGSTPLCEKWDCTCPDSSYTMTGLCDGDNTPICEKIDCQCPTVVPPYVLVGTCNASSSPTCERTLCNCNGTPGFGTTMAWETGVCDNTGDPLICHWDYADSSTPNYDIVGIWRHNDRTDKFANFYGNDYPWEVDILETSGQQVNTIRSVEYSLESYVYKNDGRDRFHLLDFNFDEAEIYNSEQTSGLLKLNISPKGDSTLITTYPIINANDIDILYSKEEQKYRFNQFWDVTTDRGEFSGVQNTIYITRLNGYIRDLNMANINLSKSSFERKKFRHYFNHVLLRRSISEDKKMLLRLNNTKLNTSQR